MTTIKKEPNLEIENKKIEELQQSPPEQENLPDEAWETKSNALITDFMNQVNIIEQLNKQRPSGLQQPQSLLNSSDLGQSNFTGKAVKVDPNDFDFDSFDCNFYKDTKKMKRTELYSREPRKMWFTRPRQARLSRQEKKKWNLKMISLCKSLHFFNIKSMKLACKYCNKFFTPNGLGGHVSRKHKNRSIQYIHREKTKKFRKLTKERNKKFTQLSIKE